jgi:putative phosphoesterase
MTKVLIISDSHSHIDERIIYYAQNADQIWHAGDVGNQKVTDVLSKNSDLKAVYGNIDDNQIRKKFNEYICFNCESVSVLITHIAGKNLKYNFKTLQLLDKYNPRILVSGHSHILKVIKDKTRGHIHINPGACGTYGFHKKRTMLRLEIDKEKIMNLEVIELGSRSKSIISID